MARGKKGNTTSKRADTLARSHSNYRVVAKNSTKIMKDMEKYPGPQMYRDCVNSFLSNLATFPTYLSTALAVAKDSNSSMPQSWIELCQAFPELEKLYKKSMNQLLDENANVLLGHYAAQQRLFKVTDVFNENQLDEDTAAAAVRAPKGKKASASTKISVANPAAAKPAVTSKATAGPKISVANPAAAKPAVASKATTAAQFVTNRDSLNNEENASCGNEENLKSVKLALPAAGDGDDEVESDNGSDGDNHDAEEAASSIPVPDTDFNVPNPGHGTVSTARVDDNDPSPNSMFKPATKHLKWSDTAVGKMCTQRAAARSTFPGGNTPSSQAFGSADYQHVQMHRYPSPFDKPSNGPLPGRNTPSSQAFGSADYRHVQMHRYPSPFDNPSNRRFQHRAPEMPKSAKALVEPDVVEVTPFEQRPVKAPEFIPIDGVVDKPEVTEVTPFQQRPLKRPEFIPIDGFVDKPEVTEVSAFETHALETPKVASAEDFADEPEVAEVTRFEERITEIERYEPETSKLDGADIVHNQAVAEVTQLEEVILETPQSGMSQSLTNAPRAMTGLLPSLLIYAPSDTSSEATDDSDSASIVDTAEDNSMQCFNDEFGGIETDDVESWAFESPVTQGSKKHDRHSDDEIIADEPASKRQCQDGVGEVPEIAQSAGVTNPPTASGIEPADETQRQDDVDKVPETAQSASVTNPPTSSGPDQDTEAKFSDLYARMGGMETGLSTLMSMMQQISSKLK